MIKQDITNRVLVISPSLNGKGGIATVVNAFSVFYKPFHHISSTHSRGLSSTIFCFPFSIFKLLYFIFFKKINIVHIHGASNGSFVRKMIFIYICYFLRRKIIYHIHGGGFESFYKKYNKFNIIRRTLKKVDVVITLTNKGKIFFEENIGLNNVSTINNFIENPNIDKDYILSVPINFLFLGRISSYKGIYDILYTIKENEEQLRGKFCLYVGGDGEITKLKNLISQLDIEDLVQYEGWVSGIRKHDLLVTCDVYILPSYYESFGMSNLEAMTYGLPIISTNIGGIPEVVSDRENGFLIRPGDKEDMIKKIMYFISNPEEIKNMGKRGQKIAANFYPEVVVPQLFNIYSKLLKNE